MKQFPWFPVGGWLGAIAALFLGDAPRLTAQTVPDWVLVWADEFNLPDGSAPEAGKWTYDLGAGGWGNGELESYTSRTNNAVIAGGCLVLTARKENYTGSDGIAAGYTSARLKTQGKWAWTYGRLEARMQLPQGQGMWPAFWLLGADITSAGWPACGEVDIMESIGREPGMVHGTAHGPGYSGANGRSAPYTLPAGATVAGGFHLYAVEWETNALRWYVDGQLYFSLSPAGLPAGTPWVFTGPQFVLLNLAVGGAWPGNPDATTSFPQQMLVDYLRVYARTNVPVAGTNLLVNAGFETNGLAGWTTYGSYVYAEPTTSYPVHGGATTCKVYGQFTGADNYSGLYQDTPARAGTNFTAAAWLLTPAEDLIAAGNSAWVEVSFRDAATNSLALYRTAVVTNTTPPGGWLELAVTNRFHPVTFAPLGDTNTLTAPPGTAFVRTQTVFHQPLYGAGSVLFDDLSLVQARSFVPIPVAVTRHGAQLQLTFPTVGGYAYLVRYRARIEAGAWQTVATVTGDGTPHSYSVTTGSAPQFYEVVVQ